MPAARQRSRSPFIAWAVMAMIGMAPCPTPRAARIAAVASKPSISGICTSISTTSNAFALDGRQRLAAVAGDDHLMPALLQQRDGQPLIDRVVLGQQDRAAGVRVDCDSGAATAGRVFGDSAMD